MRAMVGFTLVLPPAIVSSLPSRWTIDAGYVALARGTAQGSS
jgi:hypothetical protein